ncbi:CapA family protein [Haliangium sp.]|uniref:CapA family protein n=1 Tax=Haliangium sp. TaxID=2663208 RepID=UPI003D12399F
MLAAAGCGGDDGGDPEPDAASPGATPDAAASDAASGSMPDAAPNQPDAATREVPDDGSPLTFAAWLRVVDEAGAAVAGAAVELGDRTLTTDARGEVLVGHYADPVVAVVSAPGALPEPVVVGHSDDGTTVVVRLWGDGGGRRWAMHSAGDYMLARRFYDGVGQVGPLIDPVDVAAGARYVVAPVARAFAAAALSTVNLETVVSELPDSAQYPQKGVLINSHPDTLAALTALGVDVAVLGNNHIYDYQEPGMSATMSALDGVGVAYVGAAAAGVPANQALVRELGGIRVGFLSYSRLSGNNNNDAYPEDGTPEPPGLDPSLAWQYTPRSWGYAGATWTVPTEDRRIGSAWRLFRDAEPGLSEAEATAAWTSLYAVYPELQDYVARRGHGGAAYWETSPSQADISALAAEVDLVVVQIHGGAEFQPAPSRSGVDAARAAIDAGADLVIVHHPHVLQGLEWYRGKLIAHSMGNFVFDQEEHRATPSAFVRTVWDGSELIEARLVPLDLGGYRPGPLADAAALRHLRRLWELSLLPTVSGRDGDGDFRSIMEPVPAEVEPVHLRLRHHGAVLSAVAPVEEALSVRVPAGESVALDYPGLIHGRAGGVVVRLGRELFGWGDFEDGVADDMQTHAVHWQLGHEDAALAVGAEAGQGLGYATLARDQSNSADANVVPLTRVPIPAHRLFRDEAGEVVPATGEADYSIRFRVRMEGQSSAYVRVDLYPGDGLRADAGKQGEIVIPVEIPADGAWHEREVWVPRAGLSVAGERMEAIRPHIRLRAPDLGACVLAVDDVRIIEWRLAAQMPDHFGAYDYVENPGPEDIDVSLRALPLRDVASER